MRSASGPLRAQAPDLVRAQSGLFRQQLVVGDHVQQTLGNAQTRFIAQSKLIKRR